MLRETAPASLLALCDDVPLNVQLLDSINLSEIECHLCRFFALEQSSDDSLHYRFAVHGDWNTDAERFVDFSGFLDEHIKNNAVNYVVGTIEKDRFDFWSRLPIAIYSALALLKPIGIPWQIVVQNRIEVILEVDAFAHAVGRYQDTVFSFRVGFNQVLNESCPLIVATAGSGHCNGTEIFPLLT